MDESCSSITIIQRSVIGVIADIPEILRTKQKQKPGLRKDNL